MKSDAMWTIRASTPACRRGLPVDLVPGQDLVRHDVEGVADRLAAAEQAHEARREVAVVGDCPERRPIAGDDEGLAGRIRAIAVNGISQLFTARGTCVVA